MKQAIANGDQRILVGACPRIVVVIDKWCVGSWIILGIHIRWQAIVGVCHRNCVTASSGTIVFENIPQSGVSCGCTFTAFTIEFKFVALSVVCVQSAAWCLQSLNLNSHRLTMNRVTYQCASYRIQQLFRPKCGVCLQQGRRRETNEVSFCYDKKSSTTILFILRLHSYPKATNSRCLQNAERESKTCDYQPAAWQVVHLWRAMASGHHVDDAIYKHSSKYIKLFASYKKVNANTHCKQLSSRTNCTHLFIA